MVVDRFDAGSASEWWSGGRTGGSGCWLLATGKCRPREGSIPGQLQEPAPDDLGSILDLGDAAEPGRTLCRRVLHGVSGAVGVSSVVDVENDDAVAGVVDAVADPVLAPAGPPQPFDGCAQRRAHDPWSGGEGALDELPGGERRGRGECVGEGSACARGEDDGVRRFVGSFSGHDARAVAVRP